MLFQEIPEASMEKKDILVVIISILAFAVVALVVKPLLAGQSILPLGGQQQEGTLSPAGTYPTVVPTTVPPGNPPVTTPTVPTTPATPAPTPTPWDGSVKKVGFVDQPGSQGQAPPSPTIPEDVAPNRSLETFAVISGQWSGTTENLYIPFPSWVMEYTAEPTTLSGDVFPRFVIQVFDAQNPNRDVFHDDQVIYLKVPEEPWVHKFYEGNRAYYFKVDTRFINSYTIRIKVPSEYVG
jgi:hypothetical protein